MSRLTLNPYTLKSIRCAAPACSNVRESLEHHWFVTLVKEGNFTCSPLDPQQRLGNSEQPVCGQHCALRLFDRYLADLGATRKRRDRRIIVRAAISSEPSPG